MRRVRVLLALVAVFALAPATRASSELHIVPLVGLTLRGNTNDPNIASTGAPIGTHPNIGGAVALLGESILGIEGIGVFTPSFKPDVVANNNVVQSSRALALMGNVVLTTPRRWTEYSLRPYVSGGFGLMRLSVADIGSVLPTNSNAAGFDIGGGAIGFFSKHTGMRFDFRYYRRLGGAQGVIATTGEPQLSFMSLSVGVVFRR